MPNDSLPPPHPGSAADDLSLIADAPPQPVEESEKQAVDAVRREREQLELEQLRLVNNDLLQNTQQRLTYAKRLFWVMVAWLAFVAYVVLAQGFGVGILAYGRFRLADNVVIALITTTTATVLSVFFAVANYLFPRRRQD